MKSVKTASAKAEALKAFELAMLEPSPDWRAVAERLMQAMTATAKNPKPAGAPSWWADYDLTAAQLRKAERDGYVRVTFSDHSEAFAAGLSAPGKLFNIGRSLRVCIDKWREAQSGRRFLAVPEFAEITCDNGRAFDVAECNRMTAEWRAAIVPPVDHMSDPEAIRARMVVVEAELTRRRGGQEMNRVLGDLAIRAEEARRERWNELRAIKRGLTTAELDELVSVREANVDEIKREVAAAVDAWQGAIEAGEKELAKLAARIRPDDADEFLNDVYEAEAPEPAYPEPEDEPEVESVPKPFRAASRFLSSAAPLHRFTVGGESWRIEA